MRRFAQTEAPDPQPARAKHARPRSKKPQRKRRHLVTDPGGFGMQIRAQARACPTCYAAAHGQAQPEHAASIITRPAPSDATKQPSTRS